MSLLVQSGTLRNHAEAKLASAYLAAIRQAAADTGISAQAFPQQCPCTVQQLLDIELAADEA